MTSSEFADAERRLRHRLDQVTEQRAALQTSIDSLRAARRLDFADDEHDPDGSTASLDQVRDTALLTHAETVIKEVAAARQRIADGSYGHCERCGEPIPAGRLKARPEARHCLRCAERAR